MDVTTTHEWLSAKLPEMSPERLAFYTSRKHPIRKLQDRFCYIHAKIDSIPIFPPEFHLSIEAAIKAHLNLFYLDYTFEISSTEFDSLAVREASVQCSILRSCSPLCCILDRLSNINFFLCYAYSRSLDYCNTNLISLPDSLALSSEVQP